jgi:hypothetical protein
MSSNDNNNNNNEQNIELIQKENILLKNQIQTLKEKESQYQSSISKIKQTQSEYENAYKNAIKDYSKQQEDLKNKYLEYQSILEKQNEDNEKSYMDEILLLKVKLKEKDDIINSLTEKINALNEKITKDEMNYIFKEKEYEEVIISKEKKLSELNEAIKQIVQEATDEIKRLSGQLEEFQRKGKKNNPVDFFIEKEIKDLNNNNININNNKNNRELIINSNLNKSVDNILNNNINSIKSFKQNDIIQQSQNIINNSVLLSENFKNVLKDTTTPQKPNKSFIIKPRIQNPKINNEIPMYYTQNNFFGKNEQDLMTQLYMLQNDKTILTNELKKKEKEVSFWKNLRTDLYNSAMQQSFNGIRYSPSAKYLNDFKIRNMEKTLHSYGNKINQIKKQYNESMKNHQREIEKLRNDMENSIHFTQQSRIINDRNNEEDELDDMEQKSLNEDLLHALKITIPSKEGIRNEYINSQVQKIKNADNLDNYFE